MASKKHKKFAEEETDGKEVQKGKPSRGKGRGKHHVGTNDINWWIQDSVAGRQAAAIPFVYPTGINTYTKTGLEAPVTMRLNTRLIPGINDGPNSPFNQQMRKVTSNLVQKLGGSGEASASNVGLYLLGIGNIYAYIAMCKRLYGTIKLYSPDNIFMPDGMVRTQGFDPTDLRTNAQALRVAINYWIDRINTSFAVPSDMGFLARWEQLLGNYYSDFQSLKGQVYMYNCYDYYIYDEANSKLVATTIPATGVGGLHTIADLIAFGDALIYPFMESEGMNMVSARIRRAWTSLYGVPNMDEFYLAPVVYSPEILYEIHNTTVTGSAVTSGGYYTDGVDIVEIIPANGTSYLQNNVEVLSVGELAPDCQYIDVPLPVDNITPELVMLGTRGMVTETKVTDSGGTNHVVLTSAGTDIVTGILIYGWDTNQQITSRTIISTRWHTTTPTVTNYSIMAQDIARLSKFDWCPVFTWNFGSMVVNLADTTFVGLIPDEQVRMLHRTALASAFNAKDVTPGTSN